MNIQELEQEIIRTRNRIKEAKSPYVKNDLVKHLRKLNKEKKDYYRFMKGEK